MRFGKMNRGAFLFSLLSLCFILAAGQRNNEDVEIFEHVLYSDIHQEAKTINYYRVRVTSQYFTGSQYMLIRASAQTHGSDPDIYVSKLTANPQSGITSEYSCNKKGSDTCSISPEDIFNLEVKQKTTYSQGIKCIKECTYNLKVSYSDKVFLVSNQRTIVNLEEHSGAVLTYQVPPDNNNGLTNLVLFSFESLDPYQPIDMYVSYGNILIFNRQDSDLNIIEDHDWTQITPGSRMFKFHKSNSNWCVRCYLHFLVVAEKPGVYYFTAEPRNKEVVIYNKRVNNRVVMKNTQDCFEFYIDNAQQDLVVDLQTYEGIFDFFIQPRSLPATNPSPNSVALYSAQGYHKGAVLSRNMRNRLGFKTGLFYLCAYAHTTSSFRVFANEFSFNRRFVIPLDSVYTFVNEPGDYNYFIFKDKMNKFGEVFVEFNATNSDTSQGYPQVFYKICNQQYEDECSLTRSEAMGNGVTKVEGLNKAVTVASIAHDPNSCPMPNNCVYMFTVVNNATQNITANIKFWHKNYDPHTMKIGDAYANILKIDSYEFYELFLTKEFEYIDSLTIFLESINGDADLFISTNNRLPSKENFEFQSRESTKLDGITFKKPLIGSLASGYYISVYANKYSVFNLKTTVTYTVNYNKKLQSATPIYNSIAQYKYMKDEYEEEFYSFMPDWPASEPQVIGFHAQMIFNKIFFYLEHNGFPRHYLESLHDDNDFIIIRPDSDYYFSSGQYFIRIRPDFAMYDLISERQYIYNFFPLTMPAEEWIDLYQGKSQAGFGHEEDVHFRYYLDTQRDPYNVTLNVLTGDPVLLIKVSNRPFFGDIDDQRSFDFSAGNKEDGWINITMSYDQRYGNEVDCTTSGYYLDGGNTECAIYITVKCDDWCAFNLTVRNLNDSMRFPSHLLNRKYLADRVDFKQTNYYYYPISDNDKGDIAIVLNKTNGDTKLFASLISDTTKGPFKWNYPKSQSGKIMALSSERNPAIPELIELCWRVPNEKCETDDCALLIGVEGNTRLDQSHYNLIIHANDTRINSTEPKKAWFNHSDEYHYYWFTQTKSEQQGWEAYIAVNLFNKSDDVDLYLSFGDGRLPTADDYDFKSDNIGTDFISIKSTDSWFKNNGRISQVGIFVIGVHSRTKNTTYTLQTIQSADEFVNPVQVFGDRQITTKIKPGEKHFYKYFNWGHQDYQLFVKASIEKNAVFAYLSFQSDLDWQTTTLASIPTSPENSRWWGYANKNSEIEQTFLKGDETTFCYYCWYYLTIETNHTKAVDYQIEFDVRKDTGSETIQIPLNENKGIQLPATNSIDIKKFMLTSKDDFVIKASLQTGYVDMVVGLQPESIETDYLWKSQGGIGTVEIKVSQDQENFYLGTFYFIHLRSRQGRSSLQLKVEQDKRVTELVDGHYFKDHFMTTGEQVKYYAFHLPPNKQYDLQVKVDPISPYFSPLVFVEQADSVQAIKDISKLDYPSIADYEVVHGYETTRIVDSQPLEFTFTKTSTSNSAIIISVYNFVHGLTDLRKPEFEIMVTIGNSVLKKNHLPVVPGQNPYSRGRTSVFGKLSDKFEEMKVRVFDWMTRNIN